MNRMKLEIAALSENESFARSVVAAFALPLNPSLTELSDIKTAVSEAVTNCIVHAYRHGGADDIICIECEIRSGEDCGELHIAVTDQGCGIEDVEQALLPFFTTMENDERSGMGFTIMQTFMDDFRIDSSRGKGTRVQMTKKIGAAEKGEVRERVNA